MTAVDSSAEAQKLTDIDNLKLNYSWSPDSKELVFTASDDKLRKVNLASKQITILDSSRYGGIGMPAWSPDSKWIAYHKCTALTGTPCEQSTSPWFNTLAIVRNY